MTYNYLIAGLAGTGKSTICQELTALGYNAIDTDDEFGYFEGDDTQLAEDFKAPTGEWKWHAEKLTAVLQDTESEGLYLCGGANNQADFAEFFTKRFELYIDDKTMIDRLDKRTNNMYGKHPDDLAQQLAWNKKAKQHAAQAGAILIDATQSTEAILEEILQQTKSYLISGE